MADLIPIVVFVSGLVVREMKLMLYGFNCLKKMFKNLRIPIMVFFKWIGGARDEVDALRFQLFEKETTIAELGMQKQMLEDKVMVQLKKENLEEDVQELKGEATQM
uniref:Uncharacterized protein n=1 Tax=Chenopodium quinoa TaxID=63459 RepID=A0A803MVH3_CHEQI